MAELTSADLQVETGTGIANANSYVSLTEAAAYHRLRCNSDWTDADESDQVASLIRATDYVESRWCFLGTRLTDTQKLHFPVESVLYDSRQIDVGESVPIQIKEAVYEYALRAVADSGSNLLLPDPSVDAGGFVTEKFEKIGPLEERTTWSDSRGPTTLQKFTQADRLIINSGLTSTTRGGRSCR